jgi:hypothetical protein
MGVLQVPEAGGGSSCHHEYAPAMGLGASSSPLQGQGGQEILLKPKRDGR